MKKKLSHLLALLCLTLAGPSAWAQTTFQSGDFTYEVLDEDAKTAALSRVPEEYRGAVVVPETVTNEGTTYTVTQIGSPASANDYGQSPFYCSTIESLTIPATVTKVTGSMFFYTTSDPAIQQVTIADSPNPIIFDAIGYLEHISNLYIGRDIVYDSSLHDDPGKAVFVNTDHVVIGPQVTTLRNNMFSGTGSYLVSVDLSQATSLTTLGTNVFFDSNNAGLTSIDLSNTRITSVPDFAFMNCNTLTTIKLPSTVQTIGYQAFYNCTALKDLTIPASVTSIGAQAFYYDDEMESLTIEDSETPLVLVGEYGDGLPGKTFYLGRDLVGPESAALTNRIIFTNVKNVTVGPQVTTLPANAFNGAGGVESFDFSNATSLTTIGEGTFYGCSNENLTSIDLRNTRITAIPAYTFMVCSYLATPYLPGTVTSIGYQAFYSCPKLAEITIPASVTSIGDEVFYYDDNIKSFTIEDGTTTLACGKIGDGFSGETFYLGRNVTYTSTASGQLIFTNVKNVTLGSNVTTLSNYMFSRSNLETFDWSRATGITYVPERVFNFCDALTEFTIPANITTIEASAFWNMVGDINLTIEDSDTPLSLNCSSSFNPIFEYNSVTAYIGRNILRTGNYEGRAVFNASSSYEHHLTFGPKVTTIGDREYYDCDALRSVDMSAANVTTIGDYAFSSCDNLSTIDLGTKLTTLGGQAFSYSGLTAIEFPASLKKLPGNFNNDGLFENCEQLTTVVLNEGLEEIGNCAFYDCDALTEITIPASVTKIGRAAFYCNSTPAMKRMTILDSDTPLQFVNDNSEASYGTNLLSDATLDYLYLGRSITRTETDNPLVSGAKDIEIGTKVSNIDKLFDATASVENVRAKALTPIAISTDPFSSSTYADATLWLPGGTKAAYQAADYWKNFAKMEFSSYVVTISTTGHGTLAVADIEAANGESESTLIDRETDALFTLTTDEGYELTAFTVNGVAQTPTEGQFTASNLQADLTVAATFAPIAYTLAYELVGGSVATPNPATYNIETATFTLTNPTRDGYSFAGWKQDGEGEAQTSVTIARGSTGSKAYTATWTPIIYSITLTLDGGSAEGNPATYTIEDEDFTLVNPTRTGHTFAGWKQNGEGEAQMSVTIAQGSTGDKAYTATWQVNQYTITFDSNGGTDVEPITQDYGSAVTPPANPTRTGHDFAGWSPELPATMPAGNTTVTAQWTLTTYTVTISGAGVTADNMSPKYGDNVVISIAEDDDRTLTSLTVNGTDVTAQVADGQYTISGVSGNISVVATFSSTKEFITLASATATFSCSQDLNFTGSALKAYIAAGYDKGENQVLLVRIYDVPANTGIVLKGTEAQTYKIPYTASHSYYVNMLKPHLTTDDVNAADGDYFNYVLKKDGGEYAWMRPSGGTMKLGEQKAYLQVPSGFVTAGARKLSLVFEDDATTDISRFVMPDGQRTDGRAYNLKGQRVETVGKGVYIVNGRKVVKK